MADRDPRQLHRRRMAWQIALALSLVAGSWHVVSLRMLFLVVGLAQVAGGARMILELRRGTRGWGSRVAFVAACIGSTYHLLMLALASFELLAGTLQDPPFLFQTVVWAVVDLLIVFALTWGAPDGQARARPVRQPGLV